jgi:hypothetical protein
MALVARFVDMPDAVQSVEDEEFLEERTGPSGLTLARMTNHEKSHGPLHWTTGRSMELQRVVDTFCKEDVYELEFSATIADPSLEDCPLVACSIGFTELTGYTVHEVVGRNCRFLLNGVPSNLLDDETRFRCRSFCQTVRAGKEYDSCSDMLPAGLSKSWFSLPKGEQICVQTNATKTGELFRNMFYLKQVELDDKAFILALQAGLPEEYEEAQGSAMHNLQGQVQNAWKSLDASMAKIEQVLSMGFCYQAHMRRQS